MKKTIDSLGISAFCESMAMMLQAGIQTDEAIALLIEDQEANSAMQIALGRIQTGMNEGKAFSAAVQATGAFSNYAVQMIAAGEESGRLEPVLFQLAGYFEEQKSIRQRIHSAVVYPSVMMGLIIAVLVVMLAKVLPVFTGVYDSMTGSLLASAYRYIRWAYGFCWVALAVMLALATVLLIGLILWNSEGGRKKLQHLLEKLPVTAGLMVSMGLNRFTSAMTIFLSGGYMQDNAVEESLPMAECTVVETKIKSCMGRMEQGEGFAAAAYSEKLFEPVYGRMLLAGSRSGNLDEVLGKLSGLLHEDILNRVERIVGIVDPLLSGVMMVTVGFSLISVMLPLIGMMSAIG